MLKNFDYLCENILTEGRKSDENKKFSLDLDTTKRIVDEMEDSHEDKGHFKSIVSKLSQKDYYTPKSFKSDVSRIFRKLNKDDIADGYAKIFHKFLIDHDECPCKAYDSTEGEPEESTDDSAENDWVSKEGQSEGDMPNFSEEQEQEPTNY
jgi:hypothetical protein